MNTTCALLSLALATTMVLATHVPATAQIGGIGRADGGPIGPTPLSGSGQIPDGI